MENAVNLQYLVGPLNELQTVSMKAKLESVINLPQLVTVGAQSTGKSTLLDSIVGVHFLPRGDGIVTRTPIVLQLSNSAKDSPEDLKVNSIRCDSWEDITQRIKDETKRICKSDEDISNEPIFVTIKSHKVPNLNLVDLPGLVKNKIKGQSENIPKLINDMVKKYISNENTIILAVSDAGVDIAISDSLEMAQEVDPKGERTLGILTKMDRLEGTKNLGFLTGKLLDRPLKLGYMAVKCKKIEEKPVTMEEERIEEEIFFDSDPRFDAIRDHTGIKNLVQLLEKIFVKHLAETIPRISDKIRKRIAHLEKEKDKYGVEIEGDGERTKFIMKTTSQATKDYIAMLEGEKSGSGPLDKKLEGSVKIKSIIDQNYCQALDDFHIFDELSDEQIRLAIIKAESYMPTLFFKEKVFQNLMSIQISRLQIPSLQCLELIRMEMEKIIFNLKFNEAGLYLNFKIEMQTRLKDYLNKLNDQTKVMIKNYIRSHVEIIDTENPYFKEVFDYCHKKELELQAEKEKEKQGNKLTPPIQSMDNHNVAVDIFKKGEHNEKRKKMSKNNKENSQCDFKTERNPMDTHFSEVILEEPAKIINLGEIKEKESKNLESTKLLIRCYIDIIKNDFKTNIPRFIRCFLVKSFIENINEEITTAMMSLKREELFRADEILISKKKECLFELESLVSCYKSVQNIIMRLKVD